MKDVLFFVYVGLLSLFAILKSIYCKKVIYFLIVFFYLLVVKLQNAEKLFETNVSGVVGFT